MNAYDALRKRNSITQLFRTRANAVKLARYANAHYRHRYTVERCDVNGALTDSGDYFKLVPHRRKRT